VARSRLRYGHGDDALILVIAASGLLGQRAAPFVNSSAIAEIIRDYRHATRGWGQI